MLRSLLRAALLAVAVPVVAGAQDAAATQTVPVLEAPAPTLPRTLTPRPTKAAITADDLMTRLYIFADDSMMGREAGTLGNYKATEYLAAEMKRLGLQPAGEDGGWFQVLPLKRRRVDDASTLIAGGTSLALGTQWVVSGGRTINHEQLETVYGGTMGDASARLTDEQAAGKLVVLSMPLSQEAIQTAIGAGDLAPRTAAAVAILVPQQVVGLLGYFRRPSEFVDDGSAGGSRLFIMASAADKLFPRPVAELELGAAGTTVSVNAIVEATPVAHPARNVVAILPGSDPALKHQYVAIGAHSDHVGLSPRAVDHDSMRILNHIVRPGGAEDQAKMPTAEQMEQVNAQLAEWRATNAPRPDSIFNGADDDGSGSVAVLEIAEYLASLRTRPKRSTLFVWHVGEEKGLWGSAYYTEHPTVPRDSIVAQLNLDMVGRGNASDVTGATKEGAPLRGGPDYLQLVGSRRLSTELGDLVERVNTTKKHGFTFDYAMDANGHPMNIYCRSDHYEYAKWGIPVTFFTTGGHSAYHQLTDEPQYIDYARLERVSKLVADIALELGNQPTRPLVDQPKPDPRGSCRQ
jgi:hypothetical protein